MKKAQKTLVQCDFDGTVTIGDVGFMLLDGFASGEWRQWEEKYAAEKISVGRFNKEVFSMVTADRQTLLDYIKGRVVIRPGFNEFVALSDWLLSVMASVSTSSRFWGISVCLVWKYMLRTRVSVRTDSVWNTSARMVPLWTADTKMPMLTRSWRMVTGGYTLVMDGRSSCRPGAATCCLLQPMKVTC